MRKICVVTGYRSDYTKLYSVISSIKKNPNLELKIIAIGNHLLKDAGNTIKQIESDGFSIEYKINTYVSGDSLSHMSESVGFGIIKISSILNIIKPDVVMIVGDRYEIFSVAVSSSFNNIPVAHIQGGEVSGTIDEIIRHSITKLSHIHFPSTEKSKKRILSMGEDPNYVFNVGCPAVDHIKYIKENYIKGKEEIVNIDEFQNINIDIRKKYNILIYHPNTIEFDDVYRQMMIVLLALHDFGRQTVLIYPNLDPNSEKVVLAVKDYEKKYKSSSVIKSKFKNISFNNYLYLLNYCSFLIGNSSSGIREAFMFNVPVINIGTRQNNRERTDNIIDVKCDKKEIFNALNKNYSFEVCKKNIYGDGFAGEKISNILSSINLTNILKKQFVENTL